MFVTGLAALAFHTAPEAQAQSLGDTIEKHLDKSLKDKGKPKPADEGTSKKEEPKPPSSDESASKKDKPKETKRKPPPRDDRASSKPERRKELQPERPKASPPQDSTRKKDTPPKTTTRTTARPRRSYSTTPTKRYRISPTEAPRKSEYPKRVIGRMLELDPQIGVGYRGWQPDSYPGLSISTQNYFTWSVGLQARILKLVKIYRAAYQSSGFSTPRPKGPVIAAKASGAVPGVVARALGVFGVEFDSPLLPLIRYEARAFEATAKPAQPVHVIPETARLEDDVATLYPATEEPLDAASTFETFVVAARYNTRWKPKGKEEAPWHWPFYFGVGFTRFGKPYQVRVADTVLEGLLFNGRFRGAGLALGIAVPGGAERLGISLDSQVGLGEIRLSDNFTLNELLPAEYRTGYAQGALKLSYTWPILKTKPTVLLVPGASVGGNTFFYFRTDGEGEDDLPLANWDLLWNATARLIVPL